MKNEKTENKSLRILHVEDSPLDAELIRERLADFGCPIHIDWAQNEKVFQSFLEKGGYDVIFADYRLPNFNALEALELTKSICPEIPFICISGAIGEENAVEILKQGATDYVIKDRLDKLPLALQRALDEVHEQEIRIQVEAALRESEERYRRITESITDYHYTVRIENGVAVETKQSPACEMVTGYSAEDFANDPYLWINMVAQEDRELVRENVQQILACKDVHPTEHRIIRKDGDIRWVIDTTILFRDTFGNLVSYDGVIQDITERKLAEMKLVESESRLRTIIENEPECIKIIDTIGNLIEMNPAGLRMIEADSLEQVVGCPVYNLIAPEYKEMFIELHKQVIDGKSVQMKYEVIGLKGGRRWLETNAVPMLDHDKVVHLAVTRDITERKLAEDKIKSLLAEKELILKEVHHRIKNNMNTLNAFLYLQAQTLQEPSAISALTDAGNRVQSMMVLYDKLYQSSSFNEISIKSYLPILIEQIVRNFPNNGFVRIEKKIEDFILDAKRVQPFGIIINELLTNIMKYAFIGANSGIIIVEAGVKPMPAKSGKRVYLVIQDNGRGFPELGNTDKPLGFGLSLVEMLTRQLKGTIRIENENGTKVVLEFDL